jgi:hypothetical protein
MTLESHNLIISSIKQIIAMSFTPFSNRSQRHRQSIQCLDTRHITNVSVSFQSAGCKISILRKRSPVCTLSVTCQACKSRMASSGMLRRVALVRNDVSEEPGASFIRVTKIGALGTTQAATSNRRTLRRNTNTLRRNTKWYFFAAYVGC